MQKERDETKEAVADIAKSLQVVKRINYFNQVKIQLLVSNAIQIF